MDTAPAQAFVARFPPDGEITDITHVTKLVIRPEGGGVHQASVNYMRRDSSRTTYVATLAEVREWASETPYPWFAWSLALLGFLVMLSSKALEWWVCPESLP